MTVWRGSCRLVPDDQDGRSQQRYNDIQQYEGKHTGNNIFLYNPAVVTYGEDGVRMYHSLELVVAIFENQYYTYHLDASCRRACRTAYEREKQQYVDHSKPPRIIDRYKSCRCYQRRNGKQIASYIFAEVGKSKI